VLTSCGAGIWGKRDLIQTVGKKSYRIILGFSSVSLAVHLAMSVVVIGFSAISSALDTNHLQFQKPNIVVILADDLGWSDIAPYGGEIQTPNLQRLASNGLRFTQFHNASKCHTSRASLLTGLYAQQVGMSKSKAYLQNSVTLAEVLKSAGYRTLMVGKHHGLDNPYDRGFDRYFGLRDGATNHFNPGYRRPDEPAPAQKRPGQRNWCIGSKCLQPYTPVNTMFYSTDAYTDKALEYLVEYNDESKPFFLYLSYQAPHDPLQAWPEDIAKYRGRYKEAGYRATIQKRYKSQAAIGLIDDSYQLSKPTHNDWNRLSPEEQDIEDQKMAVYAAMIDRMDQNIGRLLQQLTKSGKLDNTVIFFASDNGSSAEVVELGEGAIGAINRWTSLGPSWANVSNTPFRYFKGHSYQGGIVTPLIVYWPRVITDGGGISDFVGHFIDIMPTVLDIAETTYPKFQNDQVIPAYQGQSLVPIFRGIDLDRASPLFWDYRLGKALRSGNWKIVASSAEGIGGDGRWELYDMSVDKTETNNLADAMPHLVTELAALYDAWRADLPVNIASNP
jgi:arylsulfatase